MAERFAETDSLEDEVMGSRDTLARLASRLNQANGFAGRLPSLIFVTDEKRIKDPLPSILGLPKGAAVILRHTKAGARAKLAAHIAPIARERGLKLLIAGDAELASAVSADGLHLPEARAREAADVRARNPRWLITAAAHSAHALQVAKLAGADAALLAPVFATQSHPARAPLGLSRFLMMARASPLPVYALGGITGRNASQIAGPMVAGLAAVSALAA